MEKRKSSTRVNTNTEASNPVVTTRRSSKRKTTVTRGQGTPQTESSSQGDFHNENEESLLTEKGLTNGQLLDRPSDPSGCPSSRTLSRGNSSPAQVTTTSEQLQSSMPVTSRAKRLRGATTTSSSQYSKIAYTDRKTRSASSSLTPSGNSVTINKTNHSDPECPIEGEILQVKNGESTPEDVNSKESVREKCPSSNNSSYSTLEQEEIIEIDKNVKIESKCSEGSEDEEILSEKLTSSEAPSETGVVLGKDKKDNRNSNNTSSRSSDGKTSKSTNYELSYGNHEVSEFEKVIVGKSEKSHKKSNAKGFSASDHSAGNSVNKSSGSGSSTSNSSRNKLVDEKKLNLAPMLLMNNLPYMGELTFDTRPRRGRKPKKADICHLISKNYGIHFPNSYTNVPNTGCPVPTSTSASFSSFYSGTTKLQGKTHEKSSKKQSSSKSSANFSQCPPPTWTISPPDLLPISLTNRPNNLTSSSTSLTSSRTRSISLKKTTSTNSKSSSSCSSIKSINKNQNLTPAAGSPQSVCGGSSINLTKGTNQDEPLNLCMRDASSQNIKSQIRQNVSDFNTSYSGIMNLKLPLVSPNTLFSDFHLRQSGGNSGSRTIQQNNNAGINRDFEESISRKCRNLSNSSNNGGGSSSSTSINDSGNNKNTKVSNSEQTVGDLNLVNNLSLQMNLANSLHGQLPMTKSRGKMSHALRFAPPITVDSPVLNKSNSCSSGSNKKAKKRRSPSLKEDSNQSVDMKSHLVAPSSSSNIFLNPSSVHPNSSGAVNATESHMGGCLFGQADSGPSSGAQVSICKFKFTGGAKPSLQEKKMLSVDSGGNFRFYTDKCGSSSIKSMKSCHSGINQGSTSSTFPNSMGESYGEQDCQYAFSSLPKSAKSMSVCMPVRPSSLQIAPSPSTSGQATSSWALSSSSKGITPQPNPPSSVPISPAALELHNLHLDSRSSAGSSLALPVSSFPPSCEGEDGYSSSQSDNSNSGMEPCSEGQSSSRMGDMLGGSVHHQGESRSSSKMRLKRKRRTRKSLMREKLEKTFKEKGFLIQTQQLESAEGATYCKFRQLRKFTRYLFRSWKDYLPDNVREINNAGVNEGEGPQTSINLATTTATSSAGGNGERGGSCGSGMEMELDLTTTTTGTNSQQDYTGSREDSDDVEDNDEDCVEEDEEEYDDDEGMDQFIPALTPQVTLTQPSSPDVINNNNPKITTTTITSDIHSSSSNNTDDDSDASNDVDVENIDGTSDNSSLQHNPSVINNNNIKRKDNETSPATPDSTDNA